MSSPPVSHNQPMTIRDFIYIVSHQWLGSPAYPYPRDMIPFAMRIKSAKYKQQLQDANPTRLSMTVIQRSNFKQYASKRKGNSVCEEGGRNSRDSAWMSTASTDKGELIVNI